MGRHFITMIGTSFTLCTLFPEAVDKIVIRTSVGNVSDIDLKPVDVICTFEKAEGEWNRSVELF